MYTKQRVWMRRRRRNKIKDTFRRWRFVVHTPTIKQELTEERKQERKKERWEKSIQRKK